MLTLRGMAITNFRLIARSKIAFKRNLGVVHVAGVNGDVPHASSNMCLVGETLIDCPRDLRIYPKGIPIRDLVGKKFWTYAWRNGRIVLAKCERVWLTKKDARVVRVKLTKYATPNGAGQGGEYIPPQELVGTPDHLVRLVSGRWKALGQLKKGDRLCSLYRKVEVRESMLRWTNCKKEKYQESRFVLSELHGKRDGKEYQAHHRDENTHNEHPDNLEWLTSKDHKSLHASKRNLNGTFGPDWSVQEHPRGYAGKKHGSDVRARISKTLKNQYANGRVPTGACTRKINHTVVSVEDAGTADVYDMSVPGAENFVANGVVVHNSGKSTFMSALTWCLYGCDLTGQNLADDAVRVGESSCKVTLLFERDDKARVQVVRERSGSTTTIDLSVNGETQWSGVAKEAQHGIDSFFGQRDVFLAAHVFGYDEDYTPFALMPDREQKKLFDLLVDASDLDAAHERAKQSLTDCTTRIQNGDAAINTLQASIDTINQSLRDMNQQRVDELEGIKTKLTALEAQRDELNAKLAAAIQNRNEKRAAFDANDKADSAKMSALNAALQLCIGREKKLSFLGNKCDVCESELDADAVALLVAEATADVEKAREQCAAFELEHRERSVKLTGDLNVAAADITPLQNQVATIAEEITRLDGQREQLSKLTALMKTAATQRDEKRERLNKYKTAHAALHDLKKDLEFWVRGFGPKGIRAFRLEAVVPVLNAAAAKYSAALYGDGQRVRYATTTQLKGGAQREAFSVQLVDANGNEHRVRSAGQSLRRDVINTLALSALAERLGKRTCSLLIFDEAFRTLDVAGIDAVCELLREMANTTQAILVIEHNEEVASRFDKTITVTRRGGSSRVEFTRS